ncbi:MAG TPA: UDP-glucose 4-epimerase GalE [Jatrophihabitantaceae bacterium]|nr:UDP-glucose 4-epimerase GalE [Jatrophihabitantaceae bacterium]
MKVLVTGGAGYIGSTVVSALTDAGDEPVVIDDLSRGRAEFLTGVAHRIGDVADAAVLDAVFGEHPDISIAIHCAARMVVPESLADPLTYYRENVAKAVQFTEGLLQRGCRRLVFSSSAAVYGTPDAEIVTEASPVRPESPYARSKVMVEQILADVCAATPLAALSLRYFNPVGCDPQHRSWPYDPAPTHALGSLMRAWESRTPFYIHGNDWPTPDGTPVRDFVHVWDVALAHVAATHNWAALAGGFDIVNVGSGAATSVLQLADAFNAEVDTPARVEFDGRRPGDTVGCHTSTQKANDVLQWQPTRSVKDAVVDLLALTERQHP